MNTLKTIAIKLIGYRQKLLWYSQYRACKKQGLFYSDTKNIVWGDLGKSLIVAPHADDEWIGCYSVLMNTKSPDVFYCRFYGNDYSELNKTTRDSEILECAKQNRYNIIRSNINDRESSLRDVLARGYNSIFVPSPFDWHPEHRATFKMVYELLQLEVQLPSIYVYQISIPQRNYQNLFVSELNFEDQKKKWLSFERIYKSQVMPVYRYKLQERLNVANTDYYAAEIFAKPSRGELLNDYALACEANNDLLDSYRLSINNIGIIRTISLKAKV